MLDFVTVDRAANGDWLIGMQDGANDVKVAVRSINSSDRRALRSLAGQPVALAMSAIERLTSIVSGGPDVHGSADISRLIAGQRDFLALIVVAIHGLPRPTGELTAVEALGAGLSALLGDEPS